MLKTAYASSGIALAAAGLAILVSSRSIVLTVFSTLTVGYVLTSVTATLDPGLFGIHFICHFDWYFV